MGCFGPSWGSGPSRPRLARTAGPPAPGTTLFDTQTGFAVRRWCPPLLGLEPHCPPARYLARRRELGVLEAGRRLLRGSGITTYLVYTGLPGDLTGPAEMAAAGYAEAHEIVRLELARRAGRRHLRAPSSSFLANLAESVHGAAAHAVAFTVRGPGRTARPRPRPRAAGARRGAGRRRALAGRAAGRGRADRPRAAAPSAVDRGGHRAAPLQLHAGPGEPGLRIDRTDPALTGFVRATAGLGTDLVLLHGHLHHRHAAHLAGVFPHVYADSGAALVRIGARAAAILAEILELAPFGKILFSSGAQGLPELHVVGRPPLPRGPRTGCSAAGSPRAPGPLADAQRVAGMLAADNAQPGVRAG